MTLIVYVEQVAFDNFVINMILLCLVGKFLCLETKKIRLILASVVGVIFALLFPLFALDGILLVLAKLALGLVIISVAFEYNTLKKCLLIFFAFLLLTGLMGGAIMGLLFAFMKDVALQNGTFVYTHYIPFGVYVLLAFMVAKTFLDMLHISQKKQNLKKLQFDMQIFFENKIFPIKVFLDTGNFLKDNKTGQSIIIVSLKIFCKLFDISTMDFLLGKYKIECAKQLPIQTANKISNMLVFEVEKVVIYAQNVKIISPCQLGLSTGLFHFNLGCDAIMGYQNIV